MKRHAIAKNGSSRGRMDRRLAALAVVFTFLGIASVANTSAPMASVNFGDPLFFTRQHVIWAIFGLTLMFIASRMPSSFWIKYAPLAFVGSLVLLVLVLIPGLGSNFLGARRWIILGPFSLQPSEIVKLALALYFAYLTHKKAHIKKYVWTLALVAGLIMLQPDLGTTIVVATIGLSQLVLAAFPLFQIGVISGIGAFMALILALTSDYRRERIVTFFTGTADAHGDAYHIRQVLLAIGSGGLFGVGIGQSRQKQLFIPETATDSVFAIISEEIGFFGVVVLLSLFLFFVFTALSIAKKADSPEKAVLAGGIAVWIGSQIFLNISSMIVLTPMTGIPLPFFSYGGSALTAILIGVGILLSISRENHHEKR
jgi:cell division protein FtsW